MGHTPSAFAVEDLVIPQGASESATWPVPWEYGEGPDEATLTPPAGWPGEWVARLTVRDYRGDGSTVLAVLHSTPDQPGADGLLLLETGTEGSSSYARITPQVDPDVSAAWTWGDPASSELPVYDLEIASTTGGRILRLVEGTVTLSGEATTDA